MTHEEQCMKADQRQDDALEAVRGDVPDNGDSWTIGQHSNQISILQSEMRCVQQKLDQLTGCPGSKPCAQCGMYPFS